MEMEKRIFAVEFKAVGDSAPGTFTGYGSVFNVVDSYQEIVAPGAFAKSLSDWQKKGRMPALLWQHNSDQPIGVYTKIYEDGTGLYVEGKLLINEVQQAKEAYALLKEGAVSGLSIGFVTNKDQVDRSTGVRTLEEVDLWECSLVTFPANDVARVGSVKSRPTTVRELEKCLRDAGLSRDEAKGVALHGFKALEKQREAVASAGDEETIRQIINRNIQILRS